MAEKPKKSAMDKSKKTKKKNTTKKKAQRPKNASKSKAAKNGDMDMQHFDGLMPGFGRKASPIGRYYFCIIVCLYGQCFVYALANMLGLWWT